MSSLLAQDQNSASPKGQEGNYSGAMKDAFSYDNGRYITSLKNGRLIYSKTGFISFSGDLKKDGNNLRVCFIGVTANNQYYETDDCVYLESFQNMGKYIELGFSGSVQKRQNHYRIEPTRDANGKIKREFQRDGTTYESMTLRLVINTDFQGRVYTFNFCIIDSNGRPDCGMGSYHGTLSYKE